jgi:microsomal dipeptidase-like Zn-dependent dipeptidase
MVNFFNGFVTCAQGAEIKDVVAHFNHIRKITNVETIGIGADYDGVDRYFIFEIFFKKVNKICLLEYQLAWKMCQSIRIYLQHY